MASPFLFGPTNYAATAILATSTADASYPGPNLLDPTRPNLPWKTTTSAAIGEALIDLGSAKLVSTIGLFYVNYASVSFSADNDQAFGSPDHTSGTIAIGQNIWNECRAVRYTVSPAVTARYWKVTIPIQTPLDGSAVFSTGGVFIGSLTTLPSDTDAYPGGIEWDEEHVAEESVDPLRTQSGGLQTLQLADTPKTVLHYIRIAHVNHLTPGTGDGLAAWRTIDHAMRNNAFLWALNYGTTAEVWMMRKVTPSGWPISIPASISPMTLEECVGP